ncbi:peptidyl-prolyl cis-trans isomerase, putative [Plasmodium ovale wallikeri]|uniref:Peptidyl-prolyl cis-trans isomerase, putative n=1 Tax=Plasmodium ovale wallikeri TaxID=864142 RepID=A0A1A8YQB3_PLAOA|nr:peptidyl-prolyl cis-trans isomerase, putative [Plasmodium ovale wallikeri]
MGKHKHSKDKLYILQSEYRRDALIKKQQNIYVLTPILDIKINVKSESLICISLRPFNDPYCDEDGRLYDKKSVLEEMKKAKENNKMKNVIDIKNLIKANFYKHNNEYICPITRKYFNKNTRILLNRKTGNVYSSEIFKLFQNKNKMFDPITHDYMNKSDLIVLQDPLNSRNNLNELNKNFVQENKDNIPSIQENNAIMSILQEVKNNKMENKNLDLNRQNKQGEILKKRNEEEENKRDRLNIIESKDELKKEDLVEKKDKYFSYSYTDEEEEESSENEIKIKCENYSDNTLAQSVTSTISNVTYKNNFVYLSESQVNDMIYEHVRKKKKNSYIRLITDIGMINIELYTFMYPKLCHNFIFLCEYRYYNKTDIFKKDKNDVIVFFGSSKNNFHSAASGFYWRKKLKKHKLRKKINDEVSINKLKESLMSVNSDNDSDVAIKYVKHSEHRQMQEATCFGNIYLFKYYNQKYSNMFYICLSEEYITGDVCIGKGNPYVNADSYQRKDAHFFFFFAKDSANVRIINAWYIIQPTQCSVFTKCLFHTGAYFLPFPLVVGGSDTLGKLKNMDSFTSGDVKYTLNETIIYTNPFKDVIREMKEKRRKKEEGEQVKGNTERFIDDEVFVENENDNIGKYINWKDLKKNSKSPNSDDMNKSKLNVMKKETFSKTKKSNMDFSCW